MTLVTQHLVVNTYRVAGDDTEPCVPPESLPLPDRLPICVELTVTSSAQTPPVPRSQETAVCQLPVTVYPLIKDGHVAEDISIPRPAHLPQAVENVHR